MNLMPTVELFEKPGTARVERAIATDQRGRVYYEGTYWHARFYSLNQQVQVEVAERVTVIGRQGNALLVQPLLLVVC
ncbi:NfeD family protein [Pseudanabaena sp. FACHB-2040]|uniref:NfeD family protein n=1 Tax=Pseudanabaena sp. FACHB-2040 TaxID=2692859 RepID=UPI00168A2760|nr:NfeD family protein [Pseudanabaena sp. FACHB-2040]MBD0267142.1 NfeD family protein [Cyanobacteria bacterium Co-bin8]MBD2255967.1 NfeD family protein [Pseudanabaena sp. FACHB-2040]